MENFDKQQEARPQTPSLWGFEGNYILDIIIDHIRFTPLPEGNGDQKRRHDATNQ
jgi:hypothetical protein